MLLINLVWFITGIPVTGVPLEDQELSSYPGRSQCRVPRGHFSVTQEQVWVTKTLFWDPEENTLMSDLTKQGKHELHTFSFLSQYALSHPYDPTKERCAHAVWKGVTFRRHENRSGPRTPAWNDSWMFSLHVLPLMHLHIVPPCSLFPTERNSVYCCTS